MHWLVVSPVASVVIVAYLLVEAVDPSILVLVVRVLLLAVDHAAAAPVVVAVVAAAFVDFVEFETVHQTKKMPQIERDCKFTILQFVKLIK